MPSGKIREAKSGHLGGVYVRSCGVIRVGLSFNLNVAFDFGAIQPVDFEHAMLSIFAADMDAKIPFARCRGEVFTLSPRSGFGGMTASGPAPKSPEDISVQFTEGLRGAAVAVVVGPTAQERVELTQQPFLSEARRRLHFLSDFLAQDFNFSLCGDNQQFVLEFAHGVPQKIKARLDVGNGSLLL
jgi:hypothetical protein